MSEEQRCQHTRQWLSQGAQLIDVRTAEEFESGALPGAINLPLQTLPGLYNVIDKQAALVVYCGTGRRSEQAKNLLEQAGVRQVHNLGGFNNIHRC